MDVQDFGDITYNIDPNISDSVPNMKAYAHIVACTQETSKNVEKIIKEGRKCLSLGGDHSMSVGTVDGHLKAKPDNVALLWIDAHADINTNKTSDSGNVHGMPIALLVKELSEYWPYLPGMDWKQPVLSINNVAFIGLRSVDLYERLIIDKYGIMAFGMEDVEKYGVQTAIGLALDKIDPHRNRSIHVSFDIDGLDALEAPSTGTSVRGGLTLREGISILEAVHRTGRLGAMDLVEVNPFIGDEKDVKHTAEAAIQLIVTAFGHSRRGLRLSDLEIPKQQNDP